MPPPVRHLGGSLKALIVERYGTVGGALTATVARPAARAARISLGSV
jgi:hypothetical protein